MVARTIGDVDNYCDRLETSNFELGSNIVSQELVRTESPRMWVEVRSGE